ncbi:MAG: hypothetical protein CMJ35_05790 [Phycisphaerae bacterium]|nr:hypothetical protein [Phycisphaerae bacterium]MBM91109.1 hypothetical protein [Phycisphaerae bacterium]HCT43599.1 hypothetical protein [Phycisphaerales bacterium]
MSIALAAGTLCLTLLTSVTTTIEPEKVELAYTFKTGEPLSYTLTSGNAMTQIMPGQVISMNEETVSQITRERVATKEDGSLVINQHVSSFTMTQTAPNGTFSFDSLSEDDAAKRTDQRVESLVVTQPWDTQYVLAPGGDVVGVENLDTLQEKIGGIDSAELRAEIEESFSEMALIREVEPFIDVLPESPVGKGDTWVKAFKVDDGEMKMTATQNMEVLSVLDWKDGHYVHVRFEGQLDMTMPEGFPAFMKATDQTIKGYYIFNTHYGTVTEYSSTMKFRFAGSPGEQIGDIVMTLDLSMSYELNN